MGTTPTEQPRTEVVPGLGPIDLAAVRKGLAGRRYAELIQHHVRRQSTRQLVEGCVESTLRLPPAAQELAEAFIDRWNVRAYDAEFWRADCAVVFDAIVADAYTTLATAGVPSDDEDAFNLFQAVTLNFAATASTQPRMREFMGIRKGFLRR